MHARRSLSVISSLVGALALACALFGAGCRRDDRAAVPVKDKLQRVVLQTDWLPQAEHGGFYQALAKGYYHEAGLDVVIIPGGPGAGVKLKVAKGEADFGMHRSDDVIMGASVGLPLMIVGAVYQHDYVILMMHEESAVRNFQDLDGRTITASLGMVWIPYLEKKYGIRLNLRPVGYGLGSFFADPNEIHQGIATHEPFYAQQKRVPVRTLAMADSGYDAYHVLFARKEFLRDHPGAARAFLAASIRGWRDFLENDPEPAFTLIKEKNPQIEPALLAFSRDEMIRRKLVTGDPERGEGIGQLSPGRLERQIEILVDLKIIPASIPLRQVMTTEYLPPAPGKDD